MNLKTLKAATIAATAMVALSGQAHAEFPERNIEMLFPWGPGSALAVTQIIAEAMGDELGVNIAVVSTPGAAGTRSVQTALDNPADGYTLIDAWVAPLVLQPLAGNADWTHEDFIPLWSATAVPFALVDRQDETRWDDFAGLIDYMREHPGELRYSSGSIGNIPHMVLARVMQANDVYARNVPYSQDGDAFRDLRSGLLDFTFNNPTTYRSNSDAFRALAVLNDRAEVSAMFDGAPLVSDLGTDMELTGLAPSGWHWYVVEQGTPDDVVETLRNAMEAALNRPDVQERLIDTGFFPTMYAPDQYDEIVGSVGGQIEGARAAIEWEQEQISGN